MLADKITLAEFHEKLGKYPALIKTYNKETSMFRFLIFGD